MHCLTLVEGKHVKITRYHFLPLGRIFLEHFGDGHGDHYICLRTNCDKVTSVTDDEVNDATDEGVINF